MQSTGEMSESEHDRGIGAMRKPRFMWFWALFALAFGLIHGGPAVLPASAAAPTLSYSSEVGYGTDGVNPNSAPPLDHLRLQGGLHAEQ